MLPEKFSKGIAKSVARKVVQTKANSPHLFFAAGVAGVIGSGILACRATLKLEDTLDTIHNDLRLAKEVGEASSEGLMSEQQHTKAVAVVFTKSSISLLKLYGPAVGLGVVSVGLLAGSHIQLTRRNAALTATLAALTKAYDEYRQRVRSEFGAEKELDIYHGMKEEVREIDDKKVTVKVGDTGAHSPYSRFFDEYSTAWVRDAEMNRVFLTMQQHHFNQQLTAKGFVFLNDVYVGLGFERTSAGAIVGWLKDGEGGIDGYIDFGMFDPGNERFINGHERNVHLDFNVDGVVYDQIGDGK